MSELISLSFTTQSSWLLAQLDRQLKVVIFLEPYSPISQLIRQFVLLQIIRVGLPYYSASGAATSAFTLRRD